LYLAAGSAHHVVEPEQPRREVPTMISTLTMNEAVARGADFSLAGGCLDDVA
jgi:hypothetical protein